MIAVARLDGFESPYQGLYEVNPLAKVVTGFEDAYMGHTVGYRISAVYDYDIAVAILAEDRGISADQAEELLNIEIISSCACEDSPLFWIPADSWIDRESG